MKFIFPEMLMLIWLAPLLGLVFLYGMRKRRRILNRYASAKGLRVITPDVNPMRRRVKAGLVLAAVVFIVLAMAGPQYGYHWREIERRGIDIVIALDCSRSMLAADIEPTRLDRAKREVIDLLGMLQGDRVGLTAFAGVAFLQCPLTLDYTIFNLFLNSLTPDSFPVGGTHLADAVRVSHEAFKSEDNSEKAIILITDGESTEGDVVKAAQLAAKDHIKIFCIGVGRAGGAPIPDKQGGLKKDASGEIIMTKLDETTLQKIAAVTGGAYVRSVTGDMDLDTIYKDEIRGKMEARKLTSGRQKIGEDRFQWFLIGAIVLFLIEMFLPTARKTIAAVLIIGLIGFAPLDVHAASVHANLKAGEEAFSQGEYEKALKFFIDAQLDNPDDPRIAYNIGNAYYKLGEYDEAFQSFQEALKSQDEHLRLKSLYNTGNTHFRRQEYKDALASYKKALDIDPNDQQAKKNIEFVKKVMAQQKQQQQNRSQNNQDQDKKGQDKKDPAQNGQDPQKPKEDSSKTEPQPKDDASPKPDQNQQKPSPQDSSQAQRTPPQPEDQDKDQKQNAAKPQEDQAEKAGQARPGEPNPDEKQKAEQAQRALNRLKDQPGKAMIPMYQQRRTEKDW